jgi:hypothetical protein
MSKSVTATGPSQSKIGSMINGVFEMNSSETLSLILENRQQLNLDDAALNRIAELVRASNEKSRGAALDQLVKLFN